MLSIMMESENVENELTAIVRKLENPKQFLTFVKRYINAITKSMFSGARPDNREVRGIRWPKLAKATIERKKRLKQPLRPMVATGDLRDSIRVIKLDNTTLIYGSELKSASGFPYGGYHNAAETEPKGGRFPWLFLTETDLVNILNMTVKWLKGHL